MKKLILICLTCVLIVSCEKTNENGVGNNQHPVQDFAELFSETEKENLTNKIINFKKSSVKEICIYTIDSIPKSIDDIQILASKLAYETGIDNEENTNGLLILIAEHNAEFAFATGKETKKTLTDSICNKISKQIMIPYFSRSEYYHGVDEALNEIIVKW